MASVQGYLQSVIVAAFLTAGLQLLFSFTGIKKQIVQLAGGLLVAVTLMGPLAKWDNTFLSRSFSKLSLQQWTAATEIQSVNREIAEDIITERTCAYVRNKAAELGFTPASITVRTEFRDEYPCPAAVWISGRYTQEQRMEITKWIEQTLGIPEKAQRWEWA